MPSPVLGAGDTEIIRQSPHPWCPQSDGEGGQIPQKTMVTTTGMSLRIIVLRERSPVKKNTLYDSTHRKF